MAIRLSTKLRNNMLSSIGFKESFDLGLIGFFTGTQPASADAAATGTLLFYLYSDGASAATGLTWDAPVDGVVSKAAAQTWSGIALTGGVVGWFRIMQFVTSIAATKAAGIADDTTAKTNARVDGSVGTSGTDITVSNTSVSASAMQVLQSLSITLPSA